jgi:hypothetical protein
VRIRIGFDEVHLALRRDAQIDPAVAVDREQPVDALARLADPFGERRIELRRVLVLQPQRFR